MATDINDLVLIYISDKPTTYARIEAIDPDVKQGWWRIKLLFLTVPLQLVTWILEKEQLDGKPFTMGGTPVRLERVVPPDAEDGTVPKPAEKTRTSTGEASGEEKVISLKDRKEKE